MLLHSIWNCHEEVGVKSKPIDRIGLGCASLGNLYQPITDAVALATVDAAWDIGIRYFDTAPYYGFGLSERRLGDALRGRDRSSFTISTKVGRLLEPDPDPALPVQRDGFVTSMPFTVRFDYSYEGVMRSFEASLQRLGLARIDVLLVHDIGLLTHGSENARHVADLASGGFRALDELRRAGTIASIGLGVNEWQICIDAMEIGRWDCFLLAGRYTLLEQGALDTFLPKCAAHGAQVVLGGAYNSGILATGTGADTELRYDYAPAPSAIVAKVARIETLCAAHGVRLAAAALQFSLAHPVVHRVVVGLDDPVRVRQTADLASQPIPAAFWKQLVDEGLLDPAAPVPDDDV
jgi:D-threo-aldose 1-dehydrogenase